MSHIPTLLLTAGRTKRFSTRAIILEVEVGIASIMAHSTYVLYPKEFVSIGKAVPGISHSPIPVLPAGQTKRFSTWAIISEVEVGIAFKMAYSTYALDPQEFVSIG